MKKYLISGNEIKNKIKEYKKTGDYDIRNDVVEKCLYLCEHIALRLSRKYSVCYDDVLSYAYEGLITAVDTYDESLDPYVYNYLNRIINYHVYLGVCEITGIHRNYFSKVVPFLQHQESVYGLDPFDSRCIEKCVNYLNVTKKISIGDLDKVYSMLSLCHPVSYSQLEDSINEKLDNYIEEDEITTYDLFTDEEAALLSLESFDGLDGRDNVSSIIIYQEIQSVIEKVLERIPKRNRDCLIDKYGLNQTDIASLRELSKKYNISFTRIGTIIRQIFACIRKGTYGNYRFLKETSFPENIDYYDDVLSISDSFIRYRSIEKKD